MILKIKTMGKNALNDTEEARIEESWMFFEDVTNIHYTIYASETELTNAQMKWIVPEGVQSIWIIEDHLVESKMLFMSFFSDRMENVHLFCNTTCYLLNDNGKTIERIF